MKKLMIPYPLTRGLLPLGQHIKYDGEDWIADKIIPPTTNEPSYLIAFQVEEAQ